MTGAIFESQLKKWDRKLKKDGRKVLLYLNNCSAHSKPSLDNITLKFFPPNTTAMSQFEEQRRHKVWKSFWHETNRLEQQHKLQPLKLGYFKSSTKTINPETVADSERCPKPHTTVFPMMNSDSLKISSKNTQQFNMQSIFLKTEQKDSIVTDFYTDYVQYLHHSLRNSTTICNGPPLESLNSITTHQLHGFLAKTSSLWAKPLCPVCKVIITEMKDMANSLVVELDNHDEQHILNLTSSILPSPNTVCKAMLPACHKLNKRDGEQQEKDALSETSTNCLKCSVCMSGTKIILHKLILEKEAMKAIHIFLNESLFYNLCAELCVAFAPGASSLFLDGISFDKCMNFMNNAYNKAVPALPQLLMPQSFCKKRLKLCPEKEMATYSLVLVVFVMTFKRGLLYSNLCAN
uniref:DDE-1 domain-containing protein n=1 Tax=Ditylenchus dipsaci TaxID=166011 RepID=A0A915E9H3_9BILA